MKERPASPVIHLVQAEFSVERTSAIPLYLQVCNRIRELILDERLQAETRLPASRVLARDLDVSRMTVELAYDQLASEGFIERRQGSGTYVVDLLPATAPVKPAVDWGRACVQRAQGPLSAAAQRLDALTSFREDRAHPVQFAPCLPGEEAFPMDVWNRTLMRTLRQGRDLQQATPLMGECALRDVLADHLARTRSLSCTPDQVMIVSSTQRAVHLLAHLLVDPGDRVWLEEPGYLGARAAFQAVGADIIPVPVDAHGMNVQTGQALAPTARLVYVTPSHQYPTGATLSASRRVALLEWAAAAHGWIIEDDYDSEFRHVGRPLAPLQSIDRQDRVIYIGTFNKVLFPGLRLAYIVLPQSLIGPAKQALEASDGPASTLLQTTVAAFMEDGHFAAHLRRSRDVYQARRHALVEAAAAHLTDLVTLQATETGLHVCAWLPNGASDVAVSERIAEAGLHAPPVSPCYVGAATRSGLILGYAGVNEAAIQRGVQTLADVIRS